MQNSFIHKEKDNYIEIVINGDLLGEDIGPEIIEVVNSYIGKSVRYAVVDLSNVRYINSSGIGVLITLLTKFKNKGGDVALANPSDHVRKLLVITKLNAIFTLVASSKEATQKFNI
jgi:anti-sigma B factor antagonist